MKKNYKNATGVNTLIIITVDFDARRRYRYAAIYSIVMIGMTMYRRNKLLLLYKKKTKQISNAVIFISPNKPKLWQYLQK